MTAGTRCFAAAPSSATTDAVAAYHAGIDLYPDRIFSIQQVRAEPLDFGWFSQFAGVWNGRPSPITARIAPYSGLAGGPSLGLWRDVTLLVDSGAAFSCIAAEVIFNLSLDLRQHRSTPGGPDSLNIYMADVGIFPTDGGAMQRHGMEVGAYLGQTHIYHGLLGRDLLAHYDFRLTACERFSLTPL